MNSNKGRSWIIFFITAAFLCAVICGGLLGTLYALNRNVHNIGLISEFKPAIPSTLLDVNALEGSSLTVPLHASGAYEIGTQMQVAYYQDLPKMPVVGNSDAHGCFGGGLERG